MLAVPAVSLAQILLPGRERFPDAVAIHHGMHHLTYDRVFLDVEVVAGRLLAQGVRPGQIVAADIRRPISHWVVLLALMRIGSVSVSLTDNFQRELAVLPGLAAVICESNESRIYGTARRIAIQSDWLQGIAHASDALPSVSEANASAGRICFTSGTSGRPKAILLEASLLRDRLSGTARRTRINTRSVLWCGLGPDTAYGFTATLATWLEGAAVVFSGTGRRAFRYLADRHVNLVVASPAALNALLRDVPAGAARLQGPVIVAGGRLSVPLRDTLLDRLCTQVFVAYGSSEAGGIAFGSATDLDLHPGNVGTVFSDVEAAIFGEDGEPLPAGVQGQLRVRTASSAAAYINDQIATAAHFADGWFELGDVAQLGDGGKLTILGRPADVLNVGGVKLPPDEIDAAVRDSDGVGDACALVVSEYGEPRLAILVAGGTEPPETLAERVRSRVPGLPRFLIVSIAAIPRGSMGKVSRTALAEQVEKALYQGAVDSANVRSVGIY